MNDKRINHHKGGRDPELGIRERKAFGAYLRSVRIAKGISITQAASKAGLSVSPLSQCERGLASLSTDTFLKLAKLYEIDPDALLALAGRLHPEVEAALVSDVALLKKVRRLMEAMR